MSGPQSYLAMHSLLPSLNELKMVPEATARVAIKDLTKVSAQYALPDDAFAGNDTVVCHGYQLLPHESVRKGEVAVNVEPNSSH